MKNTILLLSLLLFVSCNNSPNKTIKTIQLNHSEIAIDNLLVGYPNGMRYVNSNLIILDNKSDSIFHLIDLVQHKYCGSYGSKGQAPTEFIRPTDVYKYDSNSLCCYDTNKRQFTKLSIDNRNKKGSS